MRVKTGVVRRRRHKRLLKKARGFYSGRRKHFRKAKEQLERSMVYAYSCLLYTSPSPRD